MSPTHTRPSSDQLLRTALWIDAGVSAASGVLQLAATQTVHTLTGIGTLLLTSSGWFLLAYGAFIAFLARLPHPPAGVVWLLILGNPVWALGCAALLTQHHAAYSALGNAWLVVNILFVLGIAALQYLGLRRRDSLTA
jgi:hypothetical protein